MARSYAKLIFTMLIFGTLAIFVRNITYSSAEIVMFRIILGLIFLFGVWKLSGKKLNTQAIKANFWRLMLSGFCMGINWASLFTAYQYVDVSIATLCCYTAPVFVIIGSVFFLKEKITWSRILSIIGAVTGMIIITGVVMGGTDPMRGIILSIVSAIFYGSITLINKTFKGLDGFEMTFFQLIGAGIIMIPYALITHSGPWTAPGTKELICILVLGFVHTGFALSVYFSAMRDLPAQSVALCSYIDPVSTIIFASIFLGEHLTILQVFGAVLIIGSALFGELWGQRNKACAKIKSGEESYGKQG